MRARSSRAGPGDPDGRAVEAGPPSPARLEELIPQGVVNHPVFEDAVRLAGDGHAEQGEAVGEVDGAVQGVDDPAAGGT